VNNYPVSEGFDMASLGFDTKLTSNVLYKQFPQITVQQYNSGSGLSSPPSAPMKSASRRRHQTLAPQDNWHGHHFTWIKGKHKIRFGTDHQLLRMNAYNSQFSAGQYFFDRTYNQGPNPAVSAPTSGHGFASMLLGVPRPARSRSHPACSFFQRYKSGYFRTTGGSASRLPQPRPALRIHFALRREVGQHRLHRSEATEPVTGGKGVFKWVPGGYHTNSNYKTFRPRVGIAFRLNAKPSSAPPALCSMLPTTASTLPPPISVPAPSSPTSSPSAHPTPSSSLRPSADRGPIPLPGASSTPRKGKAPSPARISAST
jgi:hypothetical protein